MKLYKTNVHGNPNVGLYGFCTDRYCLLAQEFTAEQVEKIRAVLQVPVHQLRIANSSLIGALVTGNTNVLLVPHTCHERELSLLKELKIPFKIIQTKLTALGNNILCNDTGALVNKEFSADTKKIIRQALNVTLHPGDIGKSDVPGSCVVHNTHGAVIHAFASPEEITEVQNLLNIKCTRATVNFGSPYVKSGLLANSHGMVIGDTSTGVEIENIYEGLGFLQKE
jgi:translation initiation factor 6